MVGRVSKDNHWVTITALWLVALKTLRWPSLVLATGLVVVASMQLGNSDEAVATTDYYVLMIFGHLMILVWASRFLNSVYAENGIALRHFKIPFDAFFQNSLKRISTYMWVFIVIALWKEYQPQKFAEDYFGQLVMLGLIGGVFIEFMALFIHQQKNQSNIWHRTASCAVMLILIGEATLTICGYYYSAIRILDHLIYMYYATLFFNIFYYLILRSFAVAQRRLTLKRRLEARAKNDDTSVLDESLDDEISLDEVKVQSTSMTKYIMSCVYVVCAYLYWSDLLSVTSYFEYITVYQIKDANNTVINTITLMSFLTVIYVATLTILIIKNLPGVLEVFIFNHFEKISRYKVTIITIITYIISAFCIIFCCARLGVSWDQLQWLVAALSVGLGFGLQEIFGNFISGIILLFERPIRIDDIITINSQSGRVTKIRIRATTITTFDKKEYIVPNKEFVTKPIVNWSLLDTVTRLTIAIGVGYSSNVQQVKELLTKIANENPYVAKDIPFSIYFMSFGDSNINLELLVYVKTISERYPCIDTLNTAIYNEFNKAGIEIAFNQLDIFIKNQKTDEELKIESFSGKEFLKKKPLPSPAV